MRNFFLAIFIFQTLFAEELVVVANSGFSEENLSREEISSIFLDKRGFIDKKRVLVMNFENSNSLRSCFENSILRKSKRSLERYWRKAYYQGKRPPKIVSSVEMLFSYLDNVAPSIGYCEANETLESNLTLLYRVTCE